LNCRFERGLCWRLSGGAARGPHGTDVSGPEHVAPAECRVGRPTAFQILDLPGARRGCVKKNGHRPAQRARPLTTTGQRAPWRGCWPRARWRGWRKPAFRMKRRASPNRAASSRDFAATSAGVPSATTEHVSDDEDGGHAGIPNPSTGHGAAYAPHRSAGRARLPTHQDRPARTLARTSAAPSVSRVCPAKALLPSRTRLRTASAASRTPGKRPVAPPHRCAARRVRTYSRRSRMAPVRSLSSLVGTYVFRARGSSRPRVSPLSASAWL